MPVRRRDSSTPAPNLPRLQQRRPIQSRSDLYKGYVPLDGAAPARESIENLDREKLWREYISCRKPCVIEGLIEEESWQGHRWTDLSYLKNIAGDAIVKIEPVDAGRDQFGTAAKRKTVTFGTFLDMLQDPKFAGKWYMTTQYDEEEEEEEEEEEGDDDDDEKEDLSVNEGDRDGEAQGTGHNGRSSVATEGDIRIDEKLLPPMDFEVSLPAPTDALAHLFPLPGPSIMGDLVLQQCNLWLGNGKSGKSSGLHHDFHDNLYMLLSGRKRFLVWPPLAHRWLEPMGKVDTVHSNGLIEYASAGQPSLQADGLSRIEAMRWLSRARLRALLEADETAARLNGEVDIAPKLRKGKGKQTSEQERLAQRLREAEVELLLLEAEAEEEGNASDLLSIASDDVSTFSDITNADLGSEEDLYVEDGDDVASPLTSADSTDHSSDPLTHRSSRKLQIREQNGRGKRRLEVDGKEKVDYGNVKGEDEESKDRGKKKRRLSDKLMIPQGGLPGGLRGSLEDLDGEFDSGSDEFADENYEGEVTILGNGGSEVDENDSESALMTLDMQSAILARARALAEGRIVIEAGNRNEEEEYSERGEDEEGGIESNQNGISHRIGTNGEGKKEDEDEDEDDEDDDDDDDSSSSIDGSSNPDDEDWSSLDAEALEEGEATLEKLAEMQDLQEERPKGHQGSDMDSDDPKSFSKISPRVMQWYFNKPFDPANTEEPTLISSANDDNRVQLLPRLGCPHPIEIHLKAGEMLYLPASWYHEVTSYSDPDEHNGIHMALNYWFHPPTATGRPIQSPIQSKGDSTMRKLHHDSTKPYLNAEAWSEIRRCVNRKVDNIRDRAAKAARDKCTTAIKK